MHNRRLTKAGKAIEIEYMQVPQNLQALIIRNLHVRACLCVSYGYARLIARLNI